MLPTESFLEEKDIDDAVWFYESAWIQSGCNDWEEGCFTAADLFPLMPCNEFILNFLICFLMDSVHMYKVFVQKVSHC